MELNKGGLDFNWDKPVPTFVEVYESGGWDDLQCLAHLTYELKEKIGRGPRVVELGTLTGRSAFGMISAGAERVYCVDIFDMLDNGYQRPFRSYNKSALEMLWESADTLMFEKIFPMPGRTDTYEKIFNLPIDMIFIDADHSYEYIKNDILMWMPKLSCSPVSLICGHDYNMKSVKKALDEILPGYKTCGGTIPEAGGVWYKFLE